VAIRVCHTIMDIYRWHTWIQNWEIPLNNDDKLMDVAMEHNLEAGRAHLGVFEGL
jgi:hypothetical protein